MPGVWFGWNVHRAQDSPLRQQPPTALDNGRPLPFLRHPPDARSPRRTVTGQGSSLLSLLVLEGEEQVFHLIVRRWGGGIVVLAIPQVTARAATGGAMKFSLNKIGAQNGGGEPSVAISPDRTIYVSAPGDAMEFWRSGNGGKSWTQGSSPESPSGDTS